MNMAEENLSRNIHTAPPVAAQEDTLKQWRERLLISILRGGVVVGLIALIASILSDIQDQGWVDLIITSVVYGVVLLMAFARLPYRLRATITVLLLYALMMNSLLSSGIRGDALVYCVGFSVFSSMMLGVWAGGIALGLSMLSIGVVGWAMVTGHYTLNYLYDQLDSAVWFSSNISMPLVTVLLIFGVVLLQREFSAAQKRENLALDELIKDREELETRVVKRTRELSLAVDVGRSVSQLRDLDLLLPRAVELIRSQFDLYYAQIFLISASGKTLTLRAGTGTVGSELLRRGHRLQIGLGSINGIVASEGKPTIVADTSASPIFKPNPLLPETRSELAVPLLAGARTVGVLDLQSRTPGALSVENLPVYEALAGQLAIAIENASLFDQAENSRREVEERVRRDTRAGWQDFLNALERGERIGYLFDQNYLSPFNAPLPQGQAEGSVKSTILVTGAPVGSVQLERAPDQPWQEEELQLLSAVVDQASRQLDNLRLLAQSESYRDDAEQAARRLTREGWEEYLRKKTGMSGYSYNQNEVQPLEPASSGVQSDQTASGIVQPLKVGTEMVGELSFEGVAGLDPATVTVVTNVTDLLSSHIEGLRLTEQTQQALIETEDLYSASAELNTAQSYTDILSVLRKHTRVGAGAKVALLNLFNRPGSEHDMPEWVQAAASWSEDPLEDVVEPAAEGISPGGEALSGRTSMAEYPSALATLHPNYPTLVEDVVNDARLDEAARHYYFGRLKSRSLMIIPLVTGGQWIGFILAGFEQPREFPPEEVRRTIALAGQAAVAANNLRLLDETQALAQREKNLRQITALVRGSTNADTILRNATRELGAVLGRKVKIQLGDASAGGEKT